METLSPNPVAFSPQTPCRAARGLETDALEGESRFGGGSEIKRAAPGGTCASLRDREEARAHGVEKEKGEQETGGGGRGARVGRGAAPEPPAFSGRAPAARSLPALAPTLSPYPAGGARPARRMWQRTRARPRAPWRWALALLALGGAGLCHAGPQLRHPVRPSARNK